MMMTMSRPWQKYAALQYASQSRHSTVVLIGCFCHRAWMWMHRELLSSLQPPLLQQRRRLRRQSSHLPLGLPTQQSRLSLRPVWRTSSGSFQSAPLSPHPSLTNIHAMLQLYHELVIPACPEPRSCCYAVPQPKAGHSHQPECRLCYDQYNQFCIPCIS